MAANLYVHFPFCRSRCSYCALYSRVGATPADRAFYVAGIAYDIIKTIPSHSPQTLKPSGPQTLSTIYFGGGSPAICDLRPLKGALAPLLGEETEFTVELHPLDVTPAKLDELKSIGVNRISMGVQSLDDDILRAMGRGYTAAEAARAFALVKSRFDNAGIDLIVGYPGERFDAPFPIADSRVSHLTSHVPPSFSSLRSWGLTHCSVYSLQNERGLKDVPDDDVVLDRIHAVADFLKALGLDRYEISNYALPGFECRHNLAVWRGEDYFGLGNGAYGRVGLKRTRGTGNGERGTGNGRKKSFAYKTTEVPPAEDLKERTLFRLRTRDGLNASRYPEWAPVLDGFVKEGLLEKKNGPVYLLTERGTEVCDSILAELV